jgi:hypothetical protein
MATALRGHDRAIDTASTVIPAQSRGNDRGTQVTGILKPTPAPCEQSTMDVVLSALIGIGLAAACGFRVFVPMLVLCIAARAGGVTLSPGFAFFASDVALIALSVATALEIAGYWVPWIDHALDVIATPAAVIAGTLMAASMFNFTPNATGQTLKWALALIAGGGVAGVIQVGTVAVRAGSTSLTGGLANPIVSTVESGASIVTSILAVVVPVFLAFSLLVMIVLAWIVIRARINRRRALVPVVA